MIFNCLDWVRDTKTPKIHPTQKPVPLLKKLIKIFTDEGDVVIDPCAGSGTSLVAAIECNRKAYGFEIKKDFYKEAKMLIDKTIEIKQYGYDKTNLENDSSSLFYQGGL
jgi:site-specific DNA-methyltransferase (adenine-specific)